MGKNARIVDDFITKLAIIISTDDSPEFQVRKQTTLQKLHNLGWFD